ncbi:hypothetical protein H9P43_006442 [Blastocladiella emersonii ATCC 22665]|nr:hypothetical protein H9P43_006442 [Blastocladiella emersonii ATCC 22665]
MNQAYIFLTWENYQYLLPLRSEDLHRVRSHDPRDPIGRANLIVSLAKWGMREDVNTLDSARPALHDPEARACIDMMIEAFAMEDTTDYFHLFHGFLIEIELMQLGEEEEAADSASNGEEDATLSMLQDLDIECRNRGLIVNSHGYDGAFSSFIEVNYTDSVAHQRILKSETPLQLSHVGLKLSDDPAAAAAGNIPTEEERDGETGLNFDTSVGYMMLIESVEVLINMAPGTGTVDENKQLWANLRAYSTNAVEGYSSSIKTIGRRNGRGIRLSTATDIAIMVAKQDELERQNLATAEELSARDVAEVEYSNVAYEPSAYVDDFGNLCGPTLTEKDDKLAFLCADALTKEYDELAACMHGDTSDPAAYDLSAPHMPMSYGEGDSSSEADAEEYVFATYRVC